MPMPGALPGLGRELPRDAQQRGAYGLARVLAQARHVRGAGGERGAPERHVDAGLGPRRQLARPAVLVVLLAGLVARVAAAGRDRAVERAVASHRAALEQADAQLLALERGAHVEQAVAVAG